MNTERDRLEDENIKLKKEYTKLYEEKIKIMNERDESYKRVYQLTKKLIEIKEDYPECIFHLGDVGLL